MRIETDAGRARAPIDSGAGAILFDPIDAKRAPQPSATCADRLGLAMRLK